jgi:hypothetical protein
MVAIICVVSQGLFSPRNSSPHDVTCAYSSEDCLFIHSRDRIAHGSSRDA